MLDAAITSLGFGFEHFLNSHEDAQRLRQSIIDIHIGIELLLKERLIRQSPLFVHKDVAEKAAIEVHLAKNQPQRGPRPNQRTVGLEGALSRLEKLGLLPKMADRTRLTRLHDLRSELVHIGSSQQLDEGLRLIAAHAVAFVDEFLREQLGVQPVKAFGTSPWTSVRRVSAKISDDSERAHQKTLAQHRQRVATLAQRDLEERMETSTSFGLDDDAEMECPACGATAYVGIIPEGTEEDENESPWVL